MTCFLFAGFFQIWHGLFWSSEFLTLKKQHVYRFWHVEFLLAHYFLTHSRIWIRVQNLIHVACFVLGIQPNELSGTTTSNQRCRQRYYVVSSVVMLFVFPHAPVQCPAFARFAFVLAIIKSLVFLPSARGLFWHAQGHPPAVVGLVSGCAFTFLDVREEVSLLDFVPAFDCPMNANLMANGIYPSKHQENF